MQITRLLLASLSVAALVTPAFAGGIPVSCTEGTRSEPQPPTIIPAWVEEVPDIQHDGWIEVTPDIYHPEQVIENDPLKVSLGSKSHSHTAGAVCILPNGWRSPGFKADCLTPQNVNSMASEIGTGFKLVPVPPTVIPASTEDVPDIEHPAYVEEVPDIEHPEQVIPNPDLVIPTRTITTMVVTGPIWNPKVVYESHTQDGSCPHGL